MVLFQFYGGYRGGVWSNFLYWLDYWGVRDVILPFILIFTVFYAVLQRINLFGTKAEPTKAETTGKKYNIVISLVIALITVIPHATGTYPPEYDVVNIINNALPEVALLVIVVVLLLVLLGLGIGEAPFLKSIAGWVAVIAAMLLVLIFVGAAIPVPFLQFIDPSVQALIVILLVFGLIIWFVTREPPSGGRETLLQKLFKEFGGKGGG